MKTFENGAGREPISENLKQQEAALQELLIRVGADISPRGDPDRLILGERMAILLSYTRPSLSHL